MIKGNESDVGNIDFELQAFFEFHRIVHTPATRCPIVMGFGSKCGILNGRVIYIEKSKLNIADM